MAKQQNTFAKRSREMEKKRKANDKIARRRRKKDQPDAAQNIGSATGDQPASTAVDSQDAAAPATGG